MLVLGLATIHVVTLTTTGGSESMLSGTYSAHIERTPEQVFDFMADIRNAPRWMRLVNRLEVPGDGTLRAGGSFMIVLEVGGRVLSHVTRVERPRALAWWNVNRGLRADFLWEFAPDGSGTRATLTVGTRPVTFGGWIVLPLFITRVKRRVRERVERLQKALT
jgi:hypothetical protein